MSEFKVIDMATWVGKDVYECFLNSQNPFVGGTSEVDIKNLYTLAKEKRTTINVLVMYVIAKAVNLIPQFRLRMINNQLVEFEKACISPPVPARGKEGYFNFCNIDFNEDLDKFIQNVKTSTTEAKSRDNIFPDKMRDDAVYISHVNGYYTALNNPHNGKYDFIPRICWGKPRKTPDKNEPVWIPLTIEAHHSVISGYHFEKFLKIFQEICDIIISW
jgi:chloramphenicol O-acetyltransferase type A